MSLSLNPLAGGLDVLLWQAVGRNGLLPAANPVGNAVQGLTGGTLNTVADPLYTSDREAYAQAAHQRPLQEVLGDMREQAALEESLSMYRKEDRPQGAGKWSVAVTSPADLLAEVARGGHAETLVRLLGPPPQWQGAV